MTSAAHRQIPSAAHHPLTLLGLLVGVVLAPLCAYSQPPDFALYNDLLAVFGFGLILVGLSLGRVLDAEWRFDGASLLLLLLIIMAMVSPVITGATWSRGFNAAAVLLPALMTVQAARSVRADYRDALLTAFCVTLVVAGVLSTLVGVVQVVAPSATDNLFIATSNGEGRAMGNMRQPNLLASLLLWSAVAAVWLAQCGWLERRLGSARRAWAALVILLWIFVWGVLLSASRTGAVGVLLLAAWALVDAMLARTGKARLSCGSRIALGLMPILGLLGWPLVHWWTQQHGVTFFSQVRLETQGMQSSVRLKLLEGTIAMVKAHPWTGVGWGDFGFAWVLSPAVNGPEYLGHAHNIFAQFLAELGLPIGLLASVLVLMGAWQAGRRAVVDRRGAGICAFMMVLIIGLHSQTEFPLWYAFFLLPTVFAYGLTLAGAGRDQAAQEGPAPQPRKDMAIAGALMIVLVPAAVRDYQPIVQLVEPSPDAPPMIERLAAAQTSTLFDYHANYALATALPPESPLTLQAARQANPVDATLMLAWARALHAAGETDKARFLVQRAKAFPDELTKVFLKTCAAPAQVEGARPFQCDPPSRAYDLRELR